MTRSKTNTHPWGFLSYTTQEIWKTNPTIVTIHVLSKKRHFLETSIAQITNLAEDTLYVTTTLTTSGVRYNTIMAEIVATSHNTNEAANSGTMQTLGHNILVCLTCTEFNINSLMACLNSLMACLGLSYQIGQREISIRTCNQVGMMVFQQIVFNTFCHTT